MQKIPLTVRGAELLKAELQRDPSRSDRVIAKAVGVSHPTVAAARAEPDATGKSYQLPATTGADGKVRTRKVTVRHPNGSTPSSSMPPVI